jgi:vacuolar-type H+-ATPase subunit E/Vma4
MKFQTLIESTDAKMERRNIRYSTYRTIVDKYREEVQELKEIIQQKDDQITEIQELISTVANVIGKPEGDTT